MNRARKINLLCKIAQSGERRRERDKIRQTEERAGMTLTDFENRVASIILSNQLGIDSSDIDVDGPQYLQSILENPDIFTRDDFEFPYSFLSDRKSPQDYVDYLKSQNIILR